MQLHEPAIERRRTTPRIGLNTASFVALPLAWNMAGGWGQGERASDEWFEPEATFEERFDQLLLRVTELDFDVVDLWTSHVHWWWGDHHRSVARSLLERHGVRVATLTGWLGKTLDEFERACGHAAALGAPILGAGSAILDEHREEVLTLLEAHDLVLALENHPEHPDALRSRVGTDAGGRLAVTIDTGWFATQGVDAADAIHKLAEHVRHVHLKDVRAAGEHEPCPFGEGVVPLERCVEALVAIGYDGVISLEQNAATYDPGPDCARYARTLRARLSEASRR